MNPVTITIKTRVKNSSIRLVWDQESYRWYILPVGFSGLHLTPTETEGIIHALQEAADKVISLNAGLDTTELFRSNNAEQ